jgi:paired amphipathic helix protein Sin3a
MHRTDTPGVIERVSTLFHGNPGLIQGFNTFLPFGYRIDISADPHDPNTITVTTPMGTTSQSTASIGVSRHANGTGFGPSNAPHPPPYGAGIPPLTSSSRPITPMTFQLPHIQQPFDATYSPNIQGQSTTAAASFLGNLNNQSLAEQQPPQGQFREAIQYLNKIKARYSDDPNRYKQFLEILQTYQKEQRHLHDVRTIA